MAYINGTATDYRSLLRKIRRFCTGRADHGTIAFTGSGNGLLYRPETAVGAVTQTWTVTLTSPTAFSVSGSVSGAQAAGTVGTPYTAAGGVISFTILAGTIAFVAGDAFTFTVTASTMPTGERWVDDRWQDYTLAAPGSNTGVWFDTAGVVLQLGTGSTANGTLALLQGASVGSVTQTWTITATSPTAFSVSGSVSGAQGTATVGTPYVAASGNLSFTITAGGSPFVAGDKFVFTVNEAVWLEHAPGLAASDAIYGGLRAYQDSGVPYYCIDLIGSIGYLSTNSFYAQPGGSNNAYNPRVTLNGTASMPFWLVVSGRRLVCVAQVGTIYEAMYLGYILPYATPGQYPFPLFVGGSLTGYSSSLTTGATGPDHRHFVDPGNYGYSYSTALLRAPDGGWRPFHNRNGTDSLIPDTDCTFPYSWQNLYTLREAVDGVTYPLTPIVLMESSPSINIWGELDGCYHVTQYGNSAANIITVNGVQYLAVPNVYRGNPQDFWALKLA